MALPRCCERPSRRRQDRKAFAWSTAREIRERAFALIERIDPGARRSAAAGIHHLRDAGSWPGEYSLDRAITPVAHPTFEPMMEGGMLDEGAVADALDAAADERVSDDVHPASPVSLARTPRQRDGAQRASERI
jgi:hypothetical protein